MVIPPPTSLLERLSRFDQFALPVPVATLQASRSDLSEQIPAAHWRINIEFTQIAFHTT